MFRSIIKGFNNMASGPKLMCTNKKIGTHDGVFHCDEVLACFMLKQIEPYQDAEVIRSRDPSILGTCDIVVDVGGVYDPQNNKFDHHQRSFDHTLSTISPDLSKNKTIKLSSAGLIYAHFGVKVLKKILKSIQTEYTGEDLEIIYRAVYDNFMEEIDAVDNGIPMYESGTPRYHISTSLSSRVHNLNPVWNSKKDVNIDELFLKAMDLVGKEFIDSVIRVSTQWYPAKQIVKKSILDRKNVHPSGKIVELKESCPWKEHLLQLEKELDIENEIKFIIFQDNLNSWRVQGIPLQPDSFLCRIFLHNDWHGVRDENLSQISGIPDCIFCHATGFIGGNKTRDGALQMALKSIEHCKNTQYQD